MTTEPSVEDRLTRAIALREAGDDNAARQLLLTLNSETPNHPEVNLQCAWIHDKLGLESEATAFYEKAIALGLDGGNLQNALLGLGSTYRTLGRYDDALTTLTRGVTTFPDDNGMKVFQAMALYNSGESKKACETLLTLLATTTSDPTISHYREAITEYAADLDRTWT